MYISKLLEKVFFKVHGQSKAGSCTSWYNTYPTVYQSFNGQICVLLACMRELLDNVVLQMKYVDILILLQYWDVFVSEHVYSSFGFIDAMLWPWK